MKECTSSGTYVRHYHIIGLLGVTPEAPNVINSLMDSSAESNCRNASCCLRRFYK